MQQKDNGSFEIEFDHVSFRYPGSEVYVIKDLNLKLDIGERMAIVGRNGSGKTTFIKLLCRLYDVTEGVIRLNGRDIREYDYEEYQKLFSVVFQDYRIFSLKLGENIASSGNVDPVSECDVYAGFDKMVGRKTAVYISHRLASCRFCNDILVFDRGNVIQRGSHDRLVHEDGMYRKLWNAQAQYYEI